MRLPATKIYRAFVELDPFTDSQCIAYIATAKRRNRVKTISGWFVIAAIAFICWLVTTAILGMSAAVFASGMPRWFVNDYLALIVLVSAFFVASVCGLLVRDVWLRWLIRSELRGAQCPGCNYSLLGLRVEEGSVQCPECGNRSDLESMGLTPADLIAEVGEC